MTDETSEAMQSGDHSWLEKEAALQEQLRHSDVLRARAGMLVGAPQMTDEQFEKQQRYQEAEQARYQAVEEEGKRHQVRVMALEAALRTPGMDGDGSILRTAKLYQDFLNGATTAH